MGNECMCPFADLVPLTHRYTFGPEAFCGMLQIPAARTNDTAAVIEAKRYTLLPSPLPLPHRETILRSHQ